MNQVCFLDELFLDESYDPSRDSSNTSVSPDQTLYQFGASLLAALIYPIVYNFLGRLALIINFQALLINLFHPY
jgi:hypothetical protein